MKKQTKHSAVAAEHSEDSVVTFGFWLYLMTDLVLFACLFATFAVLRGNTFGGPSGKDIFDANYVLCETLFLLLSSFTAGMALLAAFSGRVVSTVLALLSTFALGAGFLGMELVEFSKLASSGAGWGRSAFLSSYFTLVGTHGLHILVGLLWLMTLVVVVLRRGLNPGLTRKVLLWSMFWHFLDIVWICIFSVVYLMGIV